MRSPRGCQRARYVWVLVVLAAACSDKDNAPPRDPQDPSTGGTTGNVDAGSTGGQGGAAGNAGAGAGGAGGSAGNAGAGAGGSAGSTGSDGGACIPHTGEPVVDPKALEPCGECGAAHCIPGGLLTEEQASMLADCDDGVQKCVPDLLISSGGMFLLTTCTSLGGAEGRCLSTCVPQVQAQADRLPQDICEDGDLCAPCFDPVTGLASGACTQSCDEGPTEEPYTFDECCSGRSLCVPDALVPEDQRALLGGGGCDDGQLCAPKELAADPNAIPETCESLAGAEGRCLSTCLGDVASQSDRLPQDVCPDDYLCAPCFDPVTGDATGACNVGADPGPTDDPVVFAGCCDDGTGVELGSCVPLELVPEDQQSQLGQDSCDAAALCAPIAIAAGAYEPVTCEGPGGGEARCLPACLPALAAQAAQLVRATCAQGELCAPCYDPLTGDSTGACELEGDAPVEGPYTFPGCCDNGEGMDLGTCVPSTLVPEDQVSLLGADTCSEGLLCAPTPLATGTYVPSSCDSINGAEGRCLPSCLPDIAAQAAQLPRSTCDAGELCAPCYDPLTGAATGSCAIDGDAPTEPPYTFPTCCGSGADALGTCVPSALVSSEQAELLGQDTCSSGNLCAPTPIARGEYEPDVCQSWLGAEGRCLPACLPDVAAQASQLQDPATDECANGELCVPCFNPVTGDSTGACELEGDAPSNPEPETFPACCPTPSPNGATRGTCVPARAAGAQASSLPNLNCETLTNDADDYVCAPDEKVETPNRNFPTCTTAFSGPDNCGINILCAIARATASGYIAGKAGVCVPSCLLSEQSQDVPLYGTYTTTQLYGQSTCAAGEDCGPCEYPQGSANPGEATGLCP